MSDCYITVAGNLASTPRLRTTQDGTHVTAFRFATTPRRRDRATGEWHNGETTFYTVSCWRHLAENVVSSLVKGDPVLVHGRLCSRNYQSADGEPRTSLDIEAITVGADLARGPVVLSSRRSSAAELEDTVVPAQGLGQDIGQGIGQGSGPDGGQMDGEVGDDPRAAVA